MDQTEEPPLKTHQQHPEEVEHHENGASKMFRKVKAKAKKFKNSITNHGQSHEHDHDVVEEDDDDELEPEVIDAPGVVTGKHESLSHPRETNVPATEEIIPPGTKVFPVVSSDYTKPTESVPLQDISYGHEAPAHSVRTTDRSDKEETRDVPIHHPLTDREESRETHHEPLNTPVSLLSGTEDVTRTFSPDEDDYLSGQRKVNIESDPAVHGGGSDYLGGVSNYQSEVTDPTHKGSGEVGVTEIDESLGRMNVSDDSLDQKSGLGFERDLSTRSKEFKEFDQDFDSVLSKDPPAKFGGESVVELEKDSSTRSHDFDMKTESGMDNSSPSRSHEFDLKTESGVDKMGFGSESGADLRKDFPTGSQEFDQKIESGRNEYSPESDGGLGAPMGENFPVRSHEVELKNESGIDKDMPTSFDGEPDFLAKGRPGYGEDPEEKDSPARSEDVKVETVFGRDLPTSTHDQFSPELTRDEFEESRDDFEETRDEKTEEAKPSTYTEKFSSVLGYSGGSPVGDQTQVAGTVDEELTPVNEKEKETESAVTTKLPLSGGGSGVEDTEQVEDKGVSGKDYLAEKLTRGQEDKALSEVMAEKLNIGGGEGEEKTTTEKEVEVTVEKIPSEKISEEGEHGEKAVEEEAKGGGMVGMIKGWFGGGATEEVKPISPHSVEEAPKSSGWFGGGATEEVKPKSPHSVEESPQSLGSTVGTKGFPETSATELGDTGGGGGVVPVQKGL